MSRRSSIVAAASAIAAATALALWLAVAPAGARVVQTIPTSGPKARPYHPFAVALAPSGVLYALQTADNAADPQRIETYSPAGVPLRRWLVRATSVQGLAVDAAGNAYVTSFDTRDVLKYSPAGQLLARWQAPAMKTGSDEYPGSIAVDAGGHVLVVVSGTRIEIFDSSGQYLSTLRGPWDRPGDEISVSGLAVGASGTLYAADAKGISSIDVSAGTRQVIVGRERLRAVSRGWGVAVGPQGSIYAIHTRRIQKFGAGGGYLGSVGGHRRSNWLSAAVASDGAIFVPQFAIGLPSATLKLAPITSVDEKRPSIVVDSIAGSSAQTRASVFARLRYTLSEAALLRVTLKKRAQTTNRSHRDFGRFLYIATTDYGLASAGLHALVLERRAFRLSRGLRAGTYELTLVAQDDAGNESRPLRATFVVARR